MYLCNYCTNYSIPLFIDKTLLGSGDKYFPRIYVSAVNDGMVPQNSAGIDVRIILK